MCGALTPRFTCEAMPTRLLHQARATSCERETPGGVFHVSRELRLQYGLAVYSSRGSRSSEICLTVQPVPGSILKS